MTCGRFGGNVLNLFAGSEVKYYAIILNKMSEGQYLKTELLNLNQNCVIP
jgi:hypothetical protein